MQEAPTLQALLDRGRRVEAHRPWPRAVVDEATWQLAIEQLSSSRWTLSGLWGDDGALHMAILDPPGDPNFAVLSLLCPEGRFPSVARQHPPATRMERAIRDLFGLDAENAPDSRPWLDHGKWGVRHPLGARGAGGETKPYTFLPAEGESLHQIAVGPVHAGIIEPGHFRFHANGETIVRLEARLGYTHKGVESLMKGSDLDHAAKLAGRISGDSVVAYGVAFARAVESALAIEVPPRAHWLRALMAELERLANHFGDIGAICNDASFALMHSHCAVLRERVLRTADLCFGHRLMRDCVVPGGVSCGLEPDDTARIRKLLAEIRARFPALIELYDNTASLQDRTVGTGILTKALAAQFGAGGTIGPM